MTEPIVSSWGLLIPLRLRRDLSGLTSVKTRFSPHRYEEITSFLESIPQYTYNQFLNLLLFLHYTLTGQRLDITQAFGITDTSFQEVIGKQNSRQNYAALEEGIRHGTYHFEQNMLDLIRSGEAAKLQMLFLAASKLPTAQEGKLAESPLRQAKNIFIGWITMVGKSAAIPGGLDVEQTYRLIDTYIQECE